MHTWLLSRVSFSYWKCYLSVFMINFYLLAAAPNGPPFCILPWISHTKRFVPNSDSFFKASCWKGLFLGWMRRNWTAKLKLMKWGNESADMIEIFLLLFCQSHLLNSCYHCMSYIYAVWLSLYTALHLPKKRKTQKVKYSTNWPTLKALKLSTSFLQLVPSHKHSLNHLSIDTIFNTLILLS